MAAKNNIDTSSQLASVIDRAYSSFSYFKPFERRSYEEISSHIIDEITKGTVRESLVFETQLVKVALRHGKVAIRDINRVTGIVEGDQIDFMKGRDFRFSIEESQSGRIEDHRYYLEWMHPTNIPGSVTASSGQAQEQQIDNNPIHPDERTEYVVEYRLDMEPVITDSEVGSVTRCIVEALSREIEYAYLQLEKVYEAAFLDTATGNSLDLVVSLLGVRREGESDEKLREKARRRLVHLAKATHEALEWALDPKNDRDNKLDLRGPPKIIDDPLEPGIIRIIADGGNTNEINRVVEETRAAGVFCEIIPAVSIPFNVSIAAIVRKGVITSDIEERIQAKVIQFFGTLGIGDEVSASKLESSLLEIAGIFNQVEYFERPVLAAEDGTRKSSIDRDILQMGVAERAVLAGKAKVSTMTREQKMEGGS